VRELPNINDRISYPPVAGGRCRRQPSSGLSQESGPWRLAKDRDLIWLLVQRGRRSRPVAGSWTTGKVSNFEQEKKAKEARKKISPRTEVKEVKIAFTRSTSTDYKGAHSKPGRRFLKDGDKVKCTG